MSNIKENGVKPNTTSDHVEMLSNALQLSLLGAPKGASGALMKMFVAKRYNSGKQCKFNR